MQLRTTLRPGDLGLIVALHGTVYTAEYGLDTTFEGYVAAELGKLAQAYHSERDRLWLAETGGRVVGSVAVVGHPGGAAQLRWFLVDPAARGKGLGRRLLREALAFCRQSGARSVFLWTLSELTVAASLYREAGFQRTQTRTHALWGAVRTEERYDLLLNP
ncbi:MAG: GNAT family N-acetyltransferase [Armatimonadota bacterium]